MLESLGNPVLGMLAFGNFDSLQSAWHLGASAHPVYSHFSYIPAFAGTLAQPML